MYHDFWRKNRHSQDQLTTTKPKFSKVRSPRQSRNSRKLDDNFLCIYYVMTNELTFESFDQSQQRLAAVTSSATAVRAHVNSSLSDRRLSSRWWEDSRTDAATGSPAEATGVRLSVCLSTCLSVCPSIYMPISRVCLSLLCVSLVCECLCLQLCLCLFLCVRVCVWICV